MAELTKIPIEIRESDTDNLSPLSKPYTGIVFKSPNGTKYFLTVSDDGAIITSEVTP